MENYQVFRTLALLQERVTKLEGGAIAPPVVSSGNVANLDDVINGRLAALEGRPQVTITNVNECLAALEARIQVAVDDVNRRLAALEARPLVTLDDVNERLAALEGRPPVTLDDVNGRLSALEGRPDVTQRISALELTIASLNNS